MRRRLPPPLTGTALLYASGLLAEGGSPVGAGRTGRWHCGDGGLWIVPQRTDTRLGGINLGRISICTANSVLRHILPNDSSLLYPEAGGPDSPPAQAVQFFPECRKSRGVLFAGGRFPGQKTHQAGGLHRNQPPVYFQIPAAQPGRGDGGAGAGSLFCHLALYPQPLSHRPLFCGGPAAGKLDRPGGGIRGSGKNDPPARRTADQGLSGRGGPGVRRGGAFVLRGRLPGQSAGRNRDGL